MACRMDSAKPLSKPMLGYSQLDCQKQTSVKIESEFYHFHSRKCIWKCRLPEWRPFCPGEDELNMQQYLTLWIPPVIQLKCQMTLYYGQLYAIYTWNIHMIIVRPKMGWGQHKHWLFLTHWGRVTHICVSKLTTIGSDNGLSPGWRQAIIQTNAGILLIQNSGTNLIEILVKILPFSFKKIHLNMLSAKMVAILCRGRWADSLWPRVTPHNIIHLSSLDQIVAYWCHATTWAKIDWLWIGPIETDFSKSN